MRRSAIAPRIRSSSSNRKRRRESEEFLPNICVLALSRNSPRSSTPGGIGPRGGDAQKSEGRVPRFGVSALFHLLRNRTYVGEVAYRGEIFAGEHDAIIERDLFEVVQQKLSDQAVERRWIRKTSPSLLSGKLFDDRGNTMTPSHANKKGVRYRYYVSQALLQGRKNEAGSVARVAASDVERAVLAGLRQAVDAGVEAPIASDAFDTVAECASHRDLIERCVVRAVVRRTEITLELKLEAPEQTADDDGAEARDDRIAKVISIPFVVTQTPRKGIAYAPSSDRHMSESERQSLLTAIARSCVWVCAITSGETDFAAIAAQENLVERHVRFLAPLAYLSLRIVEAIADGRAPGDLTASGLARNLPLSWREQERRFGLN
jgi:site-specific DNA recombinase